MSSIGISKGDCFLRMKPSRHQYWLRAGLIQGGWKQSRFNKVIFLVEKNRWFYRDIFFYSTQIQHLSFFLDKILLRYYCYSAGYFHDFLDFIKLTFLSNEVQRFLELRIFHFFSMGFYRFDLFKLTVFSTPCITAKADVIGVAPISSHKIASAKWCGGTFDTILRNFSFTVPLSMLTWRYGDSRGLEV